MSYSHVLVVRVVSNPSSVGCGGETCPMSPIEPYIRKASMVLGKIRVVIPNEMVSKGGNGCCWPNPLLTTGWMPTIIGVPYPGVGRQIGGPWRSLGLAPLCSSPNVEVHPLVGVPEDAPCISRAPHISQTFDFLAKGPPPPSEHTQVCSERLPRYQKFSAKILM